MKYVRFTFVSVARETHIFSCLYSTFGQMYWGLLKFFDTLTSKEKHYFLLMFSDIQPASYKSILPIARLLNREHAATVVEKKDE